MLDESFSIMFIIIFTYIVCEHEESQLGRKNSFDRLNVCFFMIISLNYLLMEIILNNSLCFMGLFLSFRIEMTEFVQNQKI